MVVEVVEAVPKRTDQGDAASSGDLPDWELFGIGGRFIGWSCGVGGCDWAWEAETPVVELGPVVGAWEGFTEWRERRPGGSHGYRFDSKFDGLGEWGWERKRVFFEVGHPETIVKMRA